jgi:hypothetical protein
MARSRHNAWDLFEAYSMVWESERLRKPLKLLVGRPGLDPGTLGLKETFNLLRGVGLVAHVFCFQGIVFF